MKNKKIVCPKCKKEITENGLYIIQEQTHNLMINYDVSGEMEEIDEETEHNIDDDLNKSITRVSCNKCGVELDLTYDEIFNQLPKIIKLKNGKK